MRYYDLSLSSPSGQLLALTQNGFAPSTTGLPTFSSRVANPQGSGTVNNPGALAIEFDMPIVPYAIPQGFQSIRIWGIGLRQIAQGANLNTTVAGVPGAGVKLVAGMKPGLPLATAAAGQAGVIVQGTVFQAFGNWQGINQTLEIVVGPPNLSPKGGIFFNWRPGASLGAALAATISRYFPSYTFSSNITASVAQTQQTVAVAHICNSFADLAALVLSQSQTIGAQLTGNSQYPGVNLAIRGTTIYAYDYAATTRAPTQLNFQDFIGQPTWIAPFTVNFKTVLRADLQVGDQFTFPPKLAASYAVATAASAIPGAAARSSSSFQGTFLINEVHQFGSFRQPDGDSWATTFSASPIGAPT